MLKNLMQPALAALLAWPLLDSMEARVTVVLTPEVGSARLIVGELDIQTWNYRGF